MPRLSPFASWLLATTVLGVGGCLYANNTSNVAPVAQPQPAASAALVVPSLTLPFSVTQRPLLRLSFPQPIPIQPATTVTRAQYAAYVSLFDPVGAGYPRLGDYGGLVMGVSQSAVNKMDPDLATQLVNNLISGGYQVALQADLLPYRGANPTCGTAAGYQAQPGQFAAALNVIQHNGGMVDYVEGDDEAHFGINLPSAARDSVGCYTSMAAVAHALATTLETGRTVFPLMRYMDTEPLNDNLNPATWVTQVVAFAGAMSAEGWPVDTLIWDIPALQATHQAVTAGLMQAKTVMSIVSLHQTANCIGSGARNTSSATFYQQAVTTCLVASGLLHDRSRVAVLDFYAGMPTVGAPETATPSDTGLAWYELNLLGVAK